MLSHDSKDEPSSVVEVVKEQIISSKDETMLSSDVSLNSTTMELLKSANSQPVSHEASVVNNSIHPPTAYAPQQIYYGGYDISVGEWDEYTQYVNADVVEMTSPGVYHTGYGYNNQTPYGPYSPATTPVPHALPPDGSLYHPHQFSYTGYAPTGPPSIPYITSPSHVPQGSLSMSSNINHQRGFISDNFLNNGVHFGPIPGYSPPHGSLVRVNFAGGVSKAGYYDTGHHFDGHHFAGSWSDSVDGTNQSLNSLMSAPGASQPVVSFGSFGQNLAPLSPAIVPPQQISMYDSGSSASSYNRIYEHAGLYNQGINAARSAVGLGTNNRTWIAVDKGRWRANGTGALCSCNGTVDILGEQNRGPRGTKPKSTDQVSPADSNDGKPSLVNMEKYNRTDFPLEYEKAKFFIIKSYNEDNVHKSIKYGVWASTPSGNRKLDSAYRESKEKDDSCPVFLLFSVNASAQFCGVSEMVGPVDFDKSVDYWQQDKWSGQFPVKWHIVKDVPNSLFRHIILENNDNKPVTNSRDTQEVRLDQGLEILKILKNYDSSVSILDDFDYYEEREIAIQESKARQQASFVGPLVVSEDKVNPPSIPGELVKSFASVVRLSESKASGIEEAETGAIGSKTGPGK